MKKIVTILLLIFALSFIFLFSIEYLFPKNLPVDDIIVSENNESGEIDITPTVIPEDINFSMSVIGDIMCHNSQYNDAYKSDGTYDFSYVFEDIKNYIANADIAVGNLETTFAGSSRGYTSYPTFNTPEQLAYNLKDLGIDVVSTANNHCMDKGYSGLVSTLNYLDDAQISHVGTNATQEEQNKILITDVKGVKIAFLSFTYGTNGIPIPSDKPYAVNLIDESLILKQLSLAKEQNPDLICVSMHWGIEYQTKQNKEQEQWANLLFENGVDIIFGSHPHVLQPMEKKTITLEDGSTKNCFVIYSLGNFMSGQVKANTRNSIILNISLTKIGETGQTIINTVDYVPIYTYKSSNGKQRYKVLDIEKAIINYDNGSDTSIGQTNYSTLKNELSKIRQTMGEKIEF